jgi:hypothetical protein
MFDVVPRIGGRAGHCPTTSSISWLTTTTLVASPFCRLRSFEQDPRDLIRCLQRGEVTDVAQRDETRAGNRRVVRLPIRGPEAMISGVTCGTSPRPEPQTSPVHVVAALRERCEDAIISA